MIAVAVLGLSGCASGGAAAEVPRERIVSLGYEDITADNRNWSDLEQRLDAAGATGVNITVGRMDWTAFPFVPAADGGPTANAASVEETGKDFVQEAVDALRVAGDGRHRSISLTIDTLVPRWIAKDEFVAGVDVNGKRSDMFPSATALERGPVGDRLNQVVATIAERYHPDTVALTELMFDDHTFGDDDVHSYERYTGEHGWPETKPDSAGKTAIDVGAKSLAVWRSHVLAGVVERARNTANQHGVKLAIDVRAPWDNPAGDRAESGHDYGQLLKVADRLIIWNYFGLNGRDAEYSEQITRALRERFGADADRVVMSVGLWADSKGKSDAADHAPEVGTGDRLTPQQLEGGLKYSATNGINAVTVTPLSLMTPDHWRSLDRAWGSEAKAGAGGD